MKAFLSVLGLGLTVFAQAAIVPAPVDHLFIPAGFDNNDNVEVVVTGNFPSTCYSRNQVFVTVVDDNINIQVNAYFNKASEAKCLTMVVPFTEVVTIGNLQAGTYKIRVNASQKKELKNSIVIAESRSSSMDEYIYARVDYIDLGFTGGTTGSAFLHAQLPSPCLEFDRVEYLSNGKDTISIMPIMKKVSDFCPMKMVPYQVPVNYPIDELSSDKVLLFTRSIEGKSVSTIINNARK